MATNYYIGKSPIGGPGDKVGKQTRGMSHCDVAIYIYGKWRIMETQICHHAKI